MTLRKDAPLVLAIFALLYALPATGAVTPAAIAQEEDTSLEEGGLVGGIISNVLDGGSEDGETNGDAGDAEINQDSTDTASSVSPNQEDQTVVQDDTVVFGDNTADIVDTNVGAPIGIVEEGIVFCFEPELPGDILCFDSLEECEIAEELVSSAEDVLGSVISGCERFETSPPNALPCSVPEGGGIIRCEMTQIPR